MELTEILLSLISLLMLVVGFFLRNIHSKIDEIDKNTTSLVTNSAVQQTKMEDIERRLNILERAFFKRT